MPNVFKSLKSEQSIHDYLALIPQLPNSENKLSPALEQCPRENFIPRTPSCILIHGPSSTYSKFKKHLVTDIYLNWLIWFIIFIFHTKYEYSCILLQKYER